MQTIRFQKKAEADGSLSLRIPLGTPDAEYEVIVVVQPKKTAGPPQASKDQTWPADYFEQTFGSIDDETFVRHPQGDLPGPVEVD